MTRRDRLEQAMDLCLSEGFDACAKALLDEIVLLDSLTHHPDDDTARFVRDWLAADTGTSRT